MDAKIFRVNYKSDFILTLTSDAGWMTPFCIKFWTGSPMLAYYASYDGTTHVHCTYDPSEPTKLTVQFDDHHLPIGNLKYQVAYHFTVADFPENTEDEVTNQANVTTVIDGDTYQVMLDLNGETAPEIQFALPAYANELQRIQNEQTRIAQEQQRIAQEQTRVNQEAARVTEFNGIVNTANNDHVRANEDHSRATSDHQNALADRSQAASDHSRAQSDHTTAGSDHSQANSDQNRAQSDHNTALSDHQTALSDHTQANTDHTRAESDHTRATADSSTAAADHRTASTDHTQANTDHARAESDHQRVETDLAEVEEFSNSLGAYDISAAHATGSTLATYPDLATALGQNGSNIPEALRKGGMSVKFVHSYDNKYVQYRLMSNAWSTTVSDWQGVDTVPTAGSKGLAQSGSVFNVASDVQALGIVPNDTTWEEGGVIMADTGKRANVTAFNSYISGFIPVSQGDYYYVGVKASASFLPIAGYSEADQETWVSSFTPARTSYNGDVQKITIPSGVNYVRVAFIPETVSFAGIWSVQDTGILPDMVARLNSNIQTAFGNVAFSTGEKVGIVGIDASPTSGSNNLAKSGSVFDVITLQDVKAALKEEKRYGTNIINPDDVVSGFLNVNGIVDNNPGLYVTGFIPVSSGQSVQAFTKVSSSSIILCFAAYDKNLKFLRGVTNNASYTQQGNEAFVRITLPVPTNAYPTLFANYGNSLLSYEAYISVKEKVSANAQNIQSISLAKDFIMESYVSYEYVKYIKSLKIYVPDSLANHTFGISIIGWNTTYNRFYFRLYDKTESAQSVYFFKEYESKPQSGIELLSGFPGSGGMSSGGGLYYFEIEIDWSLVDTYKDTLLSGLSVNVYPVSSVEHIGNTIGTVITDNIQIPDNTHLVGKGNVTIRFGKGGRFTLGSGCSIEGITFEYIGSGHISSRTEDGYIFTPIITLQQLSDETASAFYDTTNYGTIVIPSSSHNVIVSGNKFLYFNNCAIYDAGDRHTDYNHQLIANNMFVYCKTGLLVTEEFSRVIGNYFYGCVVGIYLNYGNPNILGNNFVRCDCGIYLSKLQTAHGHIVSCHFAHLGVASLYAQTIGDGLGLILDGCQIAQGPVIAKYAVGLRIQNCRLDTNFVIEDGGKCSIVNNNMRKSYATGAGVADIFDVPEDTIISGNRAIMLSESDELYNRV